MNNSHIYMKTEFGLLDFYLKMEDHQANFPLKKKISNDRHLAFNMQWRDQSCIFGQVCSSYF